MSPTIRHKINVFTLLFKELETDGKSFIFAVCHLMQDHLTSSLISLLSKHHHERSIIYLNYFVTSQLQMGFVSWETSLLMFLKINPM